MPCSETAGHPIALRLFLYGARYVLRTVALSELLFICESGGITMLLRQRWFPWLCGRSSSQLCLLTWCALSLLVILVHFPLKFESLCALILYLSFANKYEVDKTIDYIIDNN